MKNIGNALSVPKKYKDGLTRIILDGIHKTRCQIMSLEVSKAYFKGDAAELAYMKGLLSELERLREAY
jgi:uncharacterized protein YhfF